MSTTADNFRMLVARLNREDRFFHMDDDITEFDMFTLAEEAEFGAIISEARATLDADEFDKIAYCQG